MTLNTILFFVVILLCNIMHGITGFAGTILAMPFGIMLVGYDVAKPILNVLAIISGIYILIGRYKNVNWRELAKIVVVMSLGIFGGIYIRGLFVGREQILYKILGVFVIVLALQGLWKTLRPAPAPAEKPEGQSKAAALLSNLILVAAGIVHGIFVSGGPLLTSYMTKRDMDKETFRATISTCWVFLNSLILVSDIQAGLWTPYLIQVQLLSIPFLLLAMWIGSKLVARMSQALFMKITYVLLFVSGASLLIK
ncbi:MAG: sulfite exporter TauE/SafE family protein [Gemmiger sp.]